MSLIFGRRSTSSRDAANPKDLRKRDLRDALKVLRDHVRERHLRISVRAQDLAGDHDSTPRMSGEAWTDSCGLVRGVQDLALELLQVLWIGSAGTVTKMTIVELEGGGEIQVASQPVAKRVALRQAAQALGLTQAQAKVLMDQACEQVADNMLRRVG